MVRHIADLSASKVNAEEMGRWRDAWVDETAGNHAESEVALRLPTTAVKYIQSENPLTLLEVVEEERQTGAGETRGPETEHLRHLEVWIEEQIRVRAKGEAVKPKKSSEVIEERHTGRYTYRLECVRCGKESCRCMDGMGHGPYSYAY
jgi:hypothetical protein